jgi:amidase
MNDLLGAFCKHCDVAIEGAINGPLESLSFAAKDNYDVAGYTCCCGNPDWLRTHQPAQATAPAIRILLAAGAQLIGKTVMDELAFALSGENVHYGMPVNSNAPERTTGGSSSGSAAAVAGRLCDFALGSDTGGSVRIPASFCGLFGMRPTYGAVPTEGMVPHVQSADTVGWFARDAQMLRRVGDVLLGGQTDPQMPHELIILDELFALADGDAKPTLERAAARVAAAIGTQRHVTLSADGFDDWRGAYITITRYEAWSNHGDWIRKAQPAFGPAITERYAAAARVTPDEHRAALKVRANTRARLEAVLTRGAIACMPTAPFIAPLRAEAEAPQKCTALFAFTCLASLCGVPQINLPVAQFGGAPLGLSLLGPPHSDRLLLELGCRLDFQTPGLPQGKLD